MSRKVTVIIEKDDEVTTVVFTPDESYPDLARANFLRTKGELSAQFQLDFSHIFDEPNLLMSYTVDTVKKENI